MGLWQVNADTLAAGRFVVSPLAEATAALMALHKGEAYHPGERAWLDAHRPAYRQRLADDPVTDLLVGAALGPTWIADYLTPTPAGEAAWGEELERVRRTPPSVARADLETALGGPLPRALDRRDLPQRTAELLAWVWTHTVQPDWERRRRIMEADVVARTGQLGQGGWAAALDGLRPGMRWLGESRLQINVYDNPPREVSGAQLMFVPVTHHQGWVSWDAPHRYAVVYPCEGALAEADKAAAPEALGALLGPARAVVLTLLDAPKSTTQLVALTGQGLGSVGRHLKVLLDAGLAGRRRSGRSVLYFRTAVGEVLVKANSA
ncbi:transcriptional regulator [Streptomyces sp. NPDC051907]|uniref:ArsR/SmtB family transcription factor n=1 Tax=Streptomyces sp. NPDC051907 TaxID=3155284 RepID=UPI00342A15BF